MRCLSTPIREEERKIEGAAGKLFGKVDDLIREAALMAAGRKLTPERLAETSRAGLNEIFRS